MSITPAPGPLFPPDEEPRAQAAGGQTQPLSYPTQPLPPQPPPPYSAPPQAPSWNWFPPLVIAVLVVLGIANGFVFYDLGVTRKMLEQQVVLLKERNSVLERRLEANEERHGALSSEVRLNRERLGITQRDVNRARDMAKTLGEEQKQAVAQIGQVGQQVSSLREESGATGVKLGALSGEVSTAKSDIVATRKDLEQTRLQLTSAIGDISKAGVLIARNHDELVELKRRGERNYLEFDLSKEKQPRRIGDISLLLKKADPKRQRYTMELIVEDTRTEKKDKTVNEPVQFYLGRSRALYEIVVNRVGKDRITGYLATPNK